MEEDQAVHAEKELDKFTLSITREDKRALKSYAARQDKAPLRFAGGKRRNSASRVRRRR